MAIADLTDWIAEYGRPGFLWYAKRLAANDTLASGGHQAGPYVPREFLFRVFPRLHRSDLENPDVQFDLYIDSHSDHRKGRAVWYNNRLRGGTRNETRLTGLGGQKSALLDPDSTGSIAVFAFRVLPNNASGECHVWVSRNETEEDVITDRIGAVEPKAHVFWEPGGVLGSEVFEPQPERATCWLDENEIPTEWLKQFPTGEEIILKTMELRPLKGSGVDNRLVRRRRCEYEIFQSVEEAFYRPRITGGFSGIAQFLGLAQTILQSRKSRSGNSLELHIREILKEEGFRDGTDFVHHPVIEGGKRPDFLFPSKQAYDDVNFPADQLRMLGAKTTVKDRWRQVLNEADRIRTKHVLTLQEGVSEGQFREMQEANVQLVVPANLHDAYPSAVRLRLISFGTFLGQVRLASPNLG